MTKKKMTLESLAAMTQRGFKELKDGLIKRMDEGFGAVDKRFEAVDKRFEAVDKRFKIIDQRLINLESDVSYLKSRMGEVQRTLERNEELLEEHGKELNTINRVLDEFTNPRSEKRMVTHREFTALESRVISLERRVSAKSR